MNDVCNFHAEQTRGSTSKTLQILPKPGNPDFEAITADLIPFVLSQKVGTTFWHYSPPRQTHRCVPLRECEHNKCLYWESIRNKKTTKRKTSDCEMLGSTERAWEQRERLGWMNKWIDKGRGEMRAEAVCQWRMAVQRSHSPSGHLPQQTALSALKSLCCAQCGSHSEAYQPAEN